MKVLFANKFYYLKGGSETVMFQERDYLLGQGIDVVDFSMHDERNINSKYSSFFVDRIDYLSGNALVKKAMSFVHSSEAVDKLSKLLNETRPDIAHLHNIYHQLTPSIIPVLKKYGVKVVLTLHDTKLICPAYLSQCKGNICDSCAGGNFYHAFTKNCQSSIGKSLLLMAEGYFHKIKKSYEGVDKFIAPSRFLADKVTANRKGIAAVEVLRNGIDTRQFAVSDKDDGYILYFGRLSPEKGIQTLIAAHAAMTTKQRLVVVGDGPLLDDLQQQDLMHVEFMGYQRGERLKQLIESASCVVVPSECYENCSMVVLEAMAYGKLVIGSRVGGIPEQIEDGITGYLFPMGSVPELATLLDRVMAESGLRKRMGLAARHKLEREYMLKVHNEGLMRVYEHVLQF